MPPDDFSPLPLYTPRPGSRSRWATAENPSARPGEGGRANHGAKGRPCLRVQPGQTANLLRHNGPGVITRIWLTVQDRSPHVLRGLRLDFFWDGAATPAISAPLGDFFCAGHGQPVRFQSALFANPEGRSFLCHIPMPFRSGASISLTNETANPVSHLFYEIDFDDLATPMPDAWYFHAHWRRERPNLLGANYTLLPHVQGAGRFLGCCVGVRANPCYGDAWWGEGEVKIFLDGDGEWPTLCGTGLEDYLGTGWGLGVFYGPWSGCLLADAATRSYAGYRWHVPDTVLLERECRVEMQTLGGGWLDDVRNLVRAGHPVAPVSLDDSINPDGTVGWWKNPNARPFIDDSSLAKGWVNFFRQDDWSSTAYFYLDRPENGLPPLPGPDERIAAIDTSAPEPSAMA